MPSILTELYVSYKDIFFYADGMVGGYQAQKSLLAKIQLYKFRVFGIIYTVILSINPQALIIWMAGSNLPTYITLTQQTTQPGG